MKTKNQLGPVEVRPETILQIRFPDGRAYAVKLSEMLDLQRLATGAMREALAPLQQHQNTFQSTAAARAFISCKFVLQKSGAYPSND